MQKTAKKFISLLVAMTMLFSLVPNVMAATEDEFLTTFNASTISNIVANITSGAESFNKLGSIKDTLDTDIKLTLTAYNMLKQLPYDSFDDLADGFKASAESVNKAFADDTVLSYVASQVSTAVVTSKAESDTKDIFAYDSKKFILLDTDEAKGQFFVTTYENYGSKTPASTKSNKYDVTVEGNIANFLNTTFLTDGNSGNKFPDEIINHINYDNVWYTEPHWETGGTKTFGGVGFLSKTEFDEHFDKIGIDGVTNHYFLRTPNKMSNEVASRDSFMGITPNKSAGTVTGVSLGGNKARLLRPAFYLDKSFFENVTGISMGANVEASVNALLNSIAELVKCAPYKAENGEITGLYRDANITVEQFLAKIVINAAASKAVTSSEGTPLENSALVPDGAKLIIKSKDETKTLTYTIKVEDRPKITSSISVDTALEVGGSLSADFTSLDGFNITDVTYQWQMSDEENGTYADIAGATGETLTLTSDMWKKYIRVMITPVGANELAVPSDAEGPVANPKEDFALTFNTATISNIKAKLETGCAKFAELDTVKGTLSGDYPLHLAAMNMLKGIPYADFDALKDGFEASAAAVNSAFADSTALAYDAVISNTAESVEGGVEVTDAKNMFTYGGKKFIILDADTVKKQFYVTTYENYGSISPVPSDATSDNTYDASISGNVANVLNTSFLTGASALPESIVKHINYDNVWYTEPYQGTGGTKTVGGVGFMSAHEFKKYAPKIGLENFAGGYYFLRTPRSDTMSNFIGVVGTNVSGKAANGFDSLAANKGRYLRPAFYLDGTFFENTDGISDIGSDALLSIASVCDGDKLKARFGADFDNVLFPNPQITSAVINGKPILNNTLTAEYTYSSKFDEAETSYVWKSSTAQAGTYTNLPANMQTGKTILTDSTLADRYLIVEITTKNVSPYNNTGTQSSAPVLILGQASENALVADMKTAIETDKATITGFLSTNENVLQTDAMAAELMSDVSDDESNTKLNAVKDKAVDYLMDSKFSSLAEFEDVMNTCITMAKLDVLGDAEVTEPTTEDILKNPASGINTANYEALADKSAVNTLAEDTAFAGADDFITKINDKVFTEHFNQADRENIGATLTLLDDMITKDISALTPTQLQELGEELLKNDSFLNMADINTKINTLYPEDAGDDSTEVSPPITGGNNSNSGGGGGGYSSGGFSGTSSGSTSSGAVSSGFSDMQNFAWAATAVKELTERGVINGVGDGKYAPEQILTREQFVKIIVLAFGFKSTGAGADFADVPENAWYAEFVKIAYENGICNGIGDNSFGVGRPLTKEQMITFIHRALEKSGAELKATSSADIKDASSLSDYAAEAFAELVKAGVISGDENGNFNPRQSSNRAMAAVVVYNTLKNMGVI